MISVVPFSSVVSSIAKALTPSTGRGILAPPSSKCRGHYGFAALQADREQCRQQAALPNSAPTNAVTSGCAASSAKSCDFASSA
jgi:hypothetical protein